MWVALKIVVVTTGVEADGNKEEEGCLLPGTQNPRHPTHPTSWKPANKVPLLVEKAKRTLTGCAVENASCHNRRLKALNNMEGFALEQLLHQLVISGVVMQVFQVLVDLTPCRVK